MGDPRHPLRVAMQYAQVLCQLPWQGLSLGVQEHDLDAGRDDPDRIVYLMRDPGREASEGGQSLGLAGRPLQNQTLRDVSDECQCLPSTCRLHVTERDFDRELRAISSARDEIEPSSHGPHVGIPEVRGTMIDVTSTKALRHEHLERMAEQCLARIAEHLFGLSIDRDDTSLWVDQEDRL